MKDKIVVEVEFKDEGQDFLTWKIDFYPDYLLGYVVDSEPFQASIWTQYCVISGEPKEGGFITISKGPGEQMIEIKYPIEKIKILEDATNS